VGACAEQSVGGGGGSALAVDGALELAPVQGSVRRVVSFALMTEI
jgi:hypothetical protein